MKFIFQILFLFITWLINLANATPVFIKATSPNYEVSFSKVENEKNESDVKIGVSNFARSGIVENHFQKQLFTFSNSTIILSSKNESVKSYALNSHKTTSKNQNAHTQNSKKEYLSLLENRARERKVKLINNAGKWLTTAEMRTFTNDWATLYRQGLTTNTQLSKFNKACVARWKNATNSADEIFYGRNGGILNTQSSFPTISAEKGLGIHPTLQSKLPANTQWPNVANCAECDAVNQALWKGANWNDIQIHTIDIRPNGTMTDVIQCSECLNIFSGMRVTSQ